MDLTHRDVENIESLQGSQVERAKFRTAVAALQREAVAGSQSASSEDEMPTDAGLFLLEHRSAPHGDAGSTGDMSRPAHSDGAGAAPLLPNTSGKPSGSSDSSDVDPQEDRAATWKVLPHSASGDPRAVWDQAIEELSQLIKTDPTLPPGAHNSALLGEEQCWKSIRKLSLVHCAFSDCKHQCVSDDELKEHISSAHMSEMSAAVAATKRQVW